jgi:hypothetical protein
MPVSVVARSALNPSILEQTAQDFPFLPARDNVKDKNPDNSAAISYSGNGPSEAHLL